MNIKILKRPRKVNELEASHRVSTEERAYTLPLAMALRHKRRRPQESVFVRRNLKEALKIDKYLSERIIQKSPNALGT